MIKLRVTLFFLIALAIATPLQAGLLSNGGFETGSFLGWNQSGNLSFTFVESPGYSGTYAAVFGPVWDSGFISQPIPTVVGQSYTLSFWLSSGTGAPNRFDALWDNTAIPSLSLLNATPFAYTQFSATVVATGTTSTVGFGFRQDPSYWYIDDIELVANPEPGTLGLLVGGLALIGLRRWRRN